MKIYGADYYPEHWPEADWEKHIKIMKEFEIEWLRIGEFSWAFLEPKEGEFNFDLFDKAIPMLKKEGFKLILGTPTPTPPAWLIKKYPDILPVDENGNIREFGSRRHYCVDNEHFIFYSLRITEKFVERYHQYADMWQIDNEFGCHETTYCYNEETRKSFINWLKEKYNTLENLNYNWGGAFWSQLYSDWDEITIPKNTPTFKNPHQMLDFHKFSSDNVIKYSKMHKEIIRKYSDKPITHNLMVDFFDIDYFKYAKDLDIVSWDNYIPTDEYDFYHQSANHDLMRSLKKIPYFVMEQQPGRVNWRTINDQYAPEYIEFWTKQSYLHGADGSIVFRFRELPYGAEQYHGALVEYSGNPTERLLYYKKSKKETPDHIIPKKEVAIYFSYENAWIHRINHLNTTFNYWNAIVEIYKAIKMFGYNVDFVYGEDNINDYELVVVPYAMNIDNDFLNSLINYNGKIIMTSMSGIKDERNWINKEKYIDLFNKFGIKINDFSGEKNVKVLYNNNILNGEFWADKIVVKDAEIISILNNTAFKNNPIITKKGNNIYIGTVLNYLDFSHVLSLALSPKVLGKDCLITNTNDGIIILNAKNSKNTIYINNKKIEMEAFEIIKKG